jgi:hypothetical protein
LTPLPSPLPLYYLYDALEEKRNKLQAFQKILLQKKQALKQITTSYHINGHHLTDFFHIASGQSMTVDELDADSDDEVTTSFEVSMRNHGINDYLEINQQEKDMMCLWNLHINSFPSHGDRMLPIVCIRFIHRFANVIITKKLRFPLLLHFLNLWDFGLLLTEEVEEYMRMIDEYYYHTMTHHYEENDSINNDDMMMIEQQEKP